MYTFTPSSTRTSDIDLFTSLTVIGEVGFHNRIHRSPLESSFELFVEPRWGFSLGYRSGRSDDTDVLPPRRPLQVWCRFRSLPLVWLGVLEDSNYGRRGKDERFGGQSRRVTVWNCILVCPFPKTLYGTSLPPRLFNRCVAPRVIPIKNEGKVSKETRVVKICSLRFLLRSGPQVRSWTEKKRTPEYQHLLKIFQNCP